MVKAQTYTFDKVIRFIITVVILIGAFWLINYLKGVLLPFVVACLFAYLLQPIVCFNKRMLHSKKDVIPIFVTLFDVFLILFLLGRFLIPYITTEVYSMIQLFEEYAKNYLNNAETTFIPDFVHQIIIKYANIEYIQSLFTQEQWLKVIENIINDTIALMGGGVRVVMALVGWLVVLLYLIFILLDYNTMKRGFKKIIPNRFHNITFQVFNDIERNMSHYFRGQTLISLIVGVLFSIGFLIIGLPMAVLFGLFIGLLNMVPYLQLISVPIAAVLCLVYSVSTGDSFWIMFAKTIGVYVVVQLIQDFILTPKIMGKYLGLNPAIIFLSLSIWGALLGFIGLLIALPLTTLLISYYKRYVVNKDDKDTSTDSETTESECETKTIEDKGEEPTQSQTVTRQQDEHSTN